MKKVVSLFVVVAMLFCIIPAAFATGLPFTDVSPDAWFSSYVDYAYSHNFMAGTSDTAFSPNATMTRGMLVTVLHSVAQKPQHSGNNPFSDVGDSWYRNAVIWCYENNIVAGTSASTFSPNATVTREQMVAIMFKYAAARGLDTSSRADISGYSDYSRIESYARDAFSWAVANKIVSGTSKTTLSPKDGGTRAQYAVILQRFDEFSKTPVAPDMTADQKNALELAKQKLASAGFSYDGLVKQLEYEGCSHDAAVFAADNCGADWNEQAIKVAKRYLDSSAFSYDRLYEQLRFEQFTPEQAKYGVDNCVVDWNEQALSKAKLHLVSSAFSYSGLHKQLLSDQFTQEQATYGVDNCGADWNEQAAKLAKSYLEAGGYTRETLIAQLEYEGFTNEQAVYGVTQNGL